MSQLTNLLGYQAVWFIAVYGAGAGDSWPALLAALIFATWQLARSAQRSSDLRLIGAALALGMLLDGVLASTGLVRYAASAPALPPGGAPLWILALWVAFALTLNHSLSWLKDRAPLAALLGVCGGPLAYLGAGGLAGAVSLPVPSWPALTCLALGWGTALFCLALLAAAPPRRRIRPAQLPP
jgi:hypothetical protein